MEMEKIMESYGFSVSSSCSGFEWYKKNIKYKDKDAFITITNDEGLGLPVSLKEPVVIEIYDLDSGNELGKSQRFDSLQSYLDTI